MKKIIVGVSAEGSVNLLRGQMKHFKELGYITYLIAPYSKRSADFCEREGCTHLIVPLKREIDLMSDVANLFRIIRLFVRIKPSIINLGTPKVALLGLVAGRLLGIKTRIYTCRGFRYEHEKGLKRFVLITMERITARCAHSVICISQSVKELGIADGIFNAANAVVINKGSSNGVDLDLFDSERFSIEITERKRNELGLSAKFVYGFVGRIVDRKGIRELYNAFDYLYNKNSSLRLLIVGPFEDNQLRDKELIHDVKSHPGIVYLGRKSQEEVPLYLSLMDVFVLPAWWEGFGNVLVQAAAMRIPVISTLATGTKDAVGDGFNGILVPPKSVQSLKDAMQKIYDDSELRWNLGRNGQDWAKNFDKHVIWQGMQELYEEKH